MKNRKVLRIIRIPRKYNGVHQNQCQAYREMCHIPIKKKVCQTRCILSQVKLFLFLQ